MKKRCIQTAIVLLIMAGTGLFSPLSTQERVQEKVDVSWWVIPLFAVDSGGKSVEDLKEADIRLMLDNREVKEFILYKKSFSASTVEAPKARPSDPKDKEKMIFLLFDTALTTKESTERAQKIAREIVAKADENNRFVVMKISPNAGLVYAGGPLSDKERVLKLIEKGALVKGIEQQSVLGVVLDASASGRSKYEGDENRNEITDFLVPHLNRPLKRRNMSFFKSFETLFYAVNTLKSNKFIYLFTEGISKASTLGDKASTYHYYLKRVADNLSQSGAVLFILNPSGTAESGQSMASGEDSLRYLAEESGGKYLEGADENIVDRIENFHRAYYEIGFSDLPESRKNTRRVTIKSTRKGVKVHTLRSLKEKSGYAQMKKMEKEFLVLNLAGKNPLFQLSFPFRDVQVDKIEPAGEETVYHITLPEIFVGYSSDLYRIHIGRKSRQAEIEKQEISCPDSKMVLKMKNIKDKENHFVLINGIIGFAVVGRFDYLEDGRIAGFKAQPDGSLTVSAISLPRVEFRQATLYITIGDFLLRSTANGPAGKIHIQVSIRNMQGIELFDQEKTLVPRQQTVTAALPFKWLTKGRYKIVVEVKDLLTGKTALKSISPDFGGPAAQ